MPPIRTHPTRFIPSMIQAESQTLSADALGSTALPPTPLIQDGQLLLSPEGSFQNMTFSESESLGGAIYVGFPDVSTSHDPPEGRPTALPLVPYRADNTPFTPLPQMSQYMRDAQKTQWDVRFPHPHSELDHYPALVDGRVLSFIIHSPYLQVDFVVGREISEPEFTVEDVYESLYQMLCGSLSSTDPLYASRNGDERAKIEEATQQRISGTLTKISPWQGQVRDILGSRCIVGQIADDFNAGSWRIDFVEEFR